jgi:hypothetical protein
LASDNAIIPIAYYIKRIDNPTRFTLSNSYRDDRKRLEKWLRLALIKRTFSGQPDNVLRPIRNIIRDNEYNFPYEKIIGNFRRNATKSFTFTEEDLENQLFLKYGRAHTFSVLAFLYPNLDFRNRFHVDHIFPKSFFKKRQFRRNGVPEEDWDFFIENHDYLGNLQLLEGIPNEEKSNKDFKEWLIETYPDKTKQEQYKEKNYIPKDVELDFTNFKEFLEKRNKLILEKLRKVFSK